MLDRVFQETRDSGFQEEKYESLILSLRWEKRDLLQVLDSRISALVKRRYTKASVSWTDVFPHKVGDAEVGDYIVSRTMYRPRDIIQFGNYCVQHAENRPAFTRATLLAAEGEYSEKTVPVMWRRIQHGLPKPPCVRRAAKGAGGRIPAWRHID